VRKFLILTVAFFSLSAVAQSQLPSPRRYKTPLADARRKYQLKAEYNRIWKLLRYEFSYGIGATQFFGDLGGFSKNANLLGLKDITIQNTRFNINTSLRYRLQNNLSARLNLSSGFFHSTDKGGSNESRGFESKTLFFEPSVIGEYHFIRARGRNSNLLMRGRGSIIRTFFSTNDFYFFTGFGGLLYNVRQNDIPANKVNKSGGFTAIIPAGIGINKIYTRSLNISLELGGRYTFSDKLDGYTSRFSKSNDMYYFLNLTLTHKIRAGRNGLPSF
jgi:hypothetical protein